MRYRRWCNHPKVYPSCKKTCRKCCKSKCQLALILLVLLLTHFCHVEFKKNINDLFLAYEHKIHCLRADMTSRNYFKLFFNTRNYFCVVFNLTWSEFDLQGNKRSKKAHFNMQLANGLLVTYFYNCLNGFSQQPVIDIVDYLVLTRQANLFCV